MLQLGLAGAVFGVDPADIGELSISNVQRLLFSPSEQIREVQDVLVKLSGDAADLQVARSTSLAVVNNLLTRLSDRAGVPKETLFPVLPSALQAEQQLFERLQRRLSPDGAALGRRSAGTAAAGHAAQAPARPADAAAASQPAEAPAASTADGHSPMPLAPAAEPDTADVVEHQTLQTVRSGQVNMVELSTAAR